jgi:phosphoglucosamine mutase
VEREIEKDIYEVNIENQTDGELGDLGVRAEDYQESYINYLADEFKTLDLTDLKIVVDCANGAACKARAGAFPKIRRGNSRHQRRARRRKYQRQLRILHLENLQKKVLEEKADFGVAFDGDADRSLFVDEQGNLVDGDAVLWIMANHLEANGKLKNRWLWQR